MLQNSALHSGRSLSLCVHVFADTILAMCLSCYDSS